MFANLTHKIFRSTKVRFAAVGIINTTVDFVVLISLVSLFAIPAILANIISTSAALAVSYVLNRNAVFKSKNTNKTRQIIAFVGVTLTGIWVIQGMVIAVVLPVAQQWINYELAVITSKCVATIFSLGWNYIWYSRVVFADTKNRNDSI
jgi:putative flippase GtrA